MKKYTVIYIFSSLVFYVAIFCFRVNNLDSITKVMIPLFVFSVLLFVLITNFNTDRKNILLYAVFLLIFIGDVVINLTEHKEFSIMIFGVAHILLSIYYVSDTGIIGKDFLYLIPVLAFSFVLLILISEDVPDQLLLSAFTGYMAVLDFMLWRALSYLRTGQHRLRMRLIICGSLLFYLTDIFVGLYLIYPQRAFIALIWLVYPPALIMLSLMNIPKPFYLHREPL